MLDGTLEKSLKKLPNQSLKELVKKSFKEFLEEYTQKFHKQSSEDGSLRRVPKEIAGRMLKIFREFVSRIH